MTRHIGKNEFIQVLEGARSDFHGNYYAMYSSVLGAIVTDPVLMVVPIDDHLVHRGDGIFEAFKCVDGRIYNMNAHMQRLASSAEALCLDPPCPMDEMVKIVVETTRMAERKDSLVRMIVSRGPGGFSVNPYESPRTQLYVTVSFLPAPFMKKHPEGATAKTTPAIPAKRPVMATVKTCNYILNMLMQKDSVDSKVHFAIGLDDQGNLAEGPTENVGIVTEDLKLVFPDPRQILPGTTMLRCADLAASLVEQGTLSGIAFRDIPVSEALAASEVLVFGTTRDVTSVIELDGSRIGDGKPGPVREALTALLEDDMSSNADVLTPVFK